MSGKGVSIRKMKEILRLYHDANLSMHQIGKSLNLSSGAVFNHISRLKKAGITWPIPEGLYDQDLTNIIINGIKRQNSDKLVIMIAHQVVSGLFDNIFEI